MWCNDSVTIEYVIEVNVKTDVENSVEFELVILKDTNIHSYKLSWIFWNISTTRNFGPFPAVCEHYFPCFLSLNEPDESYAF